jgi:hypothetical protein
VEIGQLHNAETFEGLRQAPEPDPLMGGFEVKTAIEKPIGAGNKGGGAQGNGSLLQEPPSARGAQLGGGRSYDLLETPAKHTREAIDNPQQHGDQESEH